MARNIPQENEFIQENGLPRGEIIGHFDRYGKAQEMVDFLADRDFPVRAVTIVGNNLVSVEQVRGKLTYARVALNSAMQGAVFGLFIGFVMTLFTPTEDMFTQILTTMGIGIGMWVLFGVISYAMTGGKRDFTSTQNMVATSFDVVCGFNYVNDAKKLLKDLPGYTSYVPPVAPTMTMPQPGAQPGQQPPSEQEHPQQGQGQQGAAPVGGRFPDLPDGRPQFGVRIDQQGAAQSPQAGSGTAQQSQPRPTLDDREDKPTEDQPTEDQGGDSDQRA